MHGFLAVVILYSEVLLFYYVFPDFSLVVFTEYGLSPQVQHLHKIAPEIKLSLLLCPALQIC